MKNSNIKILLFIFFTFGVGANANGEAPHFCSPENFYAKEIAPPIQTTIKRLHLFKLGNLYLAGMAVGDSDASEVKNLARHFRVHSDNKYCTWYLNQGNHEAEQSFVHKYTQMPTEMTEDEARNNFLFALTESFTTHSPSFISCAENFSYIGIGCNAQMHRGPSAFGMFLGFLGCDPTDALEIVNTLWDLNGVDPSVRLAIIQGGYDLGQRFPGYRRKLLNITGRE